MFKKIKHQKREEELICWIEKQSGFTMPHDQKERIMNELSAAYALNGEISQNYLDSLVKKFRASEIKKEEANWIASSGNCPSRFKDNSYPERSE